MLRPLREKILRQEIEAKHMPSYYDPFRRRAMQPRPAGLPGNEEIQRLVQAYQALQAKVEQQAQQLEARQRELAAQNEALAETRRELQIKDEALHRQAEALKQTEAELVWSRAGLQHQEQQEQQKNSAEEASWRERYLRLQSELENLRRRWEQRFETDFANARQEILRDMLPLADHLELALQHGAGLQDEQAKEYIRNISATHQAFLNTLKRYNITPVEAQAQPFDPNLHEAVGQVTTGDMPSGNVAQVLQTGYMDGDKLLRPARVLLKE
jgi:molecular chaperone GrpE